MSESSLDGTIDVRIKNLDEKFMLLINEAEKRNGQRFEAQQQAIAVALQAQEKAVQAAMDSAEKAVSKSEAATDKRFDSVNEFRKALEEQTLSFLTRTEYNVQHQSLGEKVDMNVSKIHDIEKDIGAIKERGIGRHDIWTILISSVSSIATIVTLIYLIFKVH